MFDGQIQLESRSDSDFSEDAKKDFTYTAAMFCDTSRSGDKVEDIKILSGNTNLF